MKLFLFVSDLLGFLARATSAVLVALVSSLSKIIIQIIIYLIATMRKITIKIPLQISKIEKNNTQWYRVQLGKYSILFGRAK